VYINTSPAPKKCAKILFRLLRRRRNVSKYLSGAGEVFLYIYLSDTFPAPEKPGKYLKTPFRRRRSIYTHFSGAGEVLIYTYLVPEKPVKYLYTPVFECIGEKILGYISWRLVERGLKGRYRNGRNE